MRGTWSFADIETGMFDGRSFSGSEIALQLNMPDGVIAVPGEADHLSQRFDLETGAVVNYQPPRPSQEYEWDVETLRWRLSAEAARQKQILQSAQARALELENSQSRAVRELLLSAGIGSKEARDKLQAIEDGIAALPIRNADSKG
jgi:hypothetical protein